MLKELSLSNLMFFDVETVSEKASYNQLSEGMQKLWQHKHQFLKNMDEEDYSKSYENHAAIYAEFGKIVCISCGFLNEDKLRIKSFYGDNEQQLLKEFQQMMQAKTFHLCGHNIKEFDIPYICRRMLINNIDIPDLINVAGKKPWEVDFVDTLNLWKFGDYKAYTSLNLLATIFDIPTPKDDIDGSMVGKVYWQEKDLERIVTYCQKDVITVVRLLQKWKNKELIKDENVIIV